MSKFDALFQLGLHAMAGTTHAVMAHSSWGGIAGYWMNGLPVGEIWMNCYTAGLHGVPCVFLSGDRAGAEEARALIPGLETAVVKDGLSPQAAGLSVVPAVSLAPERSRQVIREAARRAMSRVGSIEPLRAEPPFALRIRYTEAGLAGGAAARPGARRVDETTVEMDGADAPWLLL